MNSFEREIIVRTDVIRRLIFHRRVGFHSRCSEDLVSAAVISNELFEPK